MARRGRRDEGEEEVTEDMEAQDEGAPAGAEFVPEATHKPKSDVYSVMLILSFLVFLAGTIIAGREAWEHYDVQFYMFSKEGKPGQSAAPPPSGEVSEPAPAPAPPPENP